MTSSDAICLGGKVSETVLWKNPRGGGGGVFGKIMRGGVESLGKIRGSDEGPLEES